MLEGVSDENLRHCPGVDTGWGQGWGRPAKVGFVSSRVDASRVEGERLEHGRRESMSLDGILLSMLADLCACACVRVRSECLFFSGKDQRDVTTTTRRRVCSRRRSVHATVLGRRRGAAGDLVSGRTRHAMELRRKGGGVYGCALQSGDQV